MRALRHIAAERALPPLAALLVADGDQRLSIDATSGLNPYGCRAAPRPEAIALATSTASSISARAFERTEDIWEALAKGAHAFQPLNEAARTELARLLGIGATGAAIVFAPSGTDAQLLALALARAFDPRPAVSILAAADETGSGAANATMGRHFSHVTSLARPVVAGAPLTGLGESVSGVAVRLRDGLGALRPAAGLDRAVHAAVRRAIGAGSRAVLFAMDHSKLGNACPSEACLDAVEAEFGPGVQIVIDACQMRLGRSRIRAHLERGRMVLITGSKFFGGPPLSGALLVPPLLAARMEGVSALPAGLNDYVAASDWPAGWRGIRAGCASRPRPGLLLRWHAALAEMANFCEAPPAARRLALARFAAVVPRAMVGFPMLSLLPEAAAAAIEDEDFPVRTIFPFTVRDRGALLTPAQAGAVYRALNRDVSGLLPAPLSAEERRLAALPCHIGQPVAVSNVTGPVGALRVSAGAGLIDSAEPPERMLEAVFAKVALIIAHRDAIGF